MFARLFADEAALQPQRQATQNGGITVAATEGVHKELSTFFAAPETRYLATFAGVVMPMEKKKGQKTGKRLRGTQVVRTQERESKYWLLHDAVETARSLRNKAPPPVHCSKPGGVPTPPASTRRQRAC